MFGFLAAHTLWPAWVYAFDKDQKDYWIDWLVVELFAVALVLVISPRLKVEYFRHFCETKFELSPKKTISLRESQEPRIVLWGLPQADNTEAETEGAVSDWKVCNCYCLDVNWDLYTYWSFVEVFLVSWRLKL